MTTKLTCTACQPERDLTGIHATGTIVDHELRYHEGAQVFVRGWDDQAPPDLADFEDDDDTDVLCSSCGWVHPDHMRCREPLAGGMEMAE